MLSEQIRRILYMYLDEKEQDKYSKPRKYSKSYCKTTSCDKMGFSQKASCKPYKDCYE